MQEEQLQWLQTLENLLLNFTVQKRNFIKIQDASLDLNQDTYINI